MRASLNIETTASLDFTQIAAAICSSLCMSVGLRLRRGGGGGRGSVTVMGGSSSRWLKSVSMRASASSRDTEAVPGATSSPLAVSIQHSWIEVAWMRARSLGSSIRKRARQNGWSIHEPQNSCRYMPRVRCLISMRLSMERGL